MSAPPHTDLIDIDIDAGPQSQAQTRAPLPQGHVDAQPTFHSIDEPAPTLINPRSTSISSSWSASHAHNTHANMAPRVPPAVYPLGSPLPSTPVTATATAPAGNTGFVSVHLEDGHGLQHRGGKRPSEHGHGHGHGHDAGIQRVQFNSAAGGPLPRSRRKIMWDRFRGKGRRKIGWGESCRNVFRSSILNVLLVFIPFAWVSAWVSDEHFNNSNLTFAFCFLSIIPLEKLFDFGGEQMALYTGKDLGDLIIITLNNAVEATLAIILLLKCELRILQATIVGVVLLHLLLVPGTGFLTGGARIYEQALHPHYTQLNHTLLAIGCLSLLIPVAFFSALDTGTDAESTLTGSVDREEFLQMSRGIAILLLLVYVASRIFLHNPPGEGNAFKTPTVENPPRSAYYSKEEGRIYSGPGEKDHENENEKEKMTMATMHQHQQQQNQLSQGQLSQGQLSQSQLSQSQSQYEEENLLNPWFCVVFLVLTIVVMAVTAELLVESIEHVREDGNITEEWFGLILLPLVSFSADGAVAVLFFLRTIIFHRKKYYQQPPKTLAEDRAIDLSIQFTLFWMPALVLVAWWTGRPLMLLFDLYEIAVLLASCFLVNYVTADSKTNWAEGYIMITFYMIIALCTWFYTGQETINTITSVCRARALGGDGVGEAAAIVEEVVGEVADII